MPLDADGRDQVAERIGRSGVVDVEVMPVNVLRIREMKSKQKITVGLAMGLMATATITIFAGHPQLALELTEDSQHAKFLTANFVGGPVNRSGFQQNDRRSTLRKIQL